MYTNFPSNEAIDQSNDLDLNVPSKDSDQPGHLQSLIC